jgi:hypothetical protein
VLLDPDDERSAALVRAHREQSPGTPVLVRHRSPDDRSDDEDAAIAGCIEVEPDGADAVAQILALIGSRTPLDDQPDPAAPPTLSEP